MNIDEKLKDIGDYFKNKIISGEFEVIDCDKCTVTVLIDEKHKFELWISNDPKIHFDFYDSSFILKKNTDFLSFKTQKERISGWEQVNSRVQAYRQNVLKIEKQEEFNRLKKELDELD